MSGSSEFRPNRTFWLTPAIGVLAGIAFLAGSWRGGHPGWGIGMLAFMLALSAAIVVVARYSETVRHLLDRRDERITRIDLLATAASGVAIILSIIVGSVVELARGHSGDPYTWLASIGGLTYLGVVVVLWFRS